MMMWARFRELMGWHRPVSDPNIGHFDGASQHSICRYCGRDIMQDSQGGWF